MMDAHTSSLRAARVLIAGNYGVGNSGDEAILSGCLDVLGQARPKVDLQVVSGDPTSTAAMHGVRSCPWDDLRGLRAAVEDSDLVVLGGGGLFHDYWRFDDALIFTEDQGHLARYCRLPLLATAAKKPLALLALGIGPLRSDTSRLHTRLAFEQAWSSSVRDTASRDLLVELGVAPDRVAIAADPAFALPPPTATHIHAARQRIGLVTDAGPQVAVAVRSWKLGPPPRTWMAAVAEGLDRFLEREAGTAVFLPFQSKTSGDRSVARAIQARMRQAARTSVVEEALTPRDLLAQVAAADLVLAMRFHALLFAIHAGVPAVALSYDPKVASLLAELDVSRLGIDLGALDGDTLAARLAEVWQRSEEIGARFRRQRERFAGQARRGVHAALALREDGRERPPEPSPELQALVARMLLHRDVSSRTSPPAPPAALDGCYDIVCFSIIHWEFRWQRPQQMMALWARRGRRVFYLRITDFLPPDGEPIAVTRLVENVWEVRVALRKPFDVYSGEHPERFVAMGIEALSALRQQFGISDAVSIVQLASWTPLARAARETFGWTLLYDCMDDWSTFPRIGGRPPMLALEETLVTAADVMAVSSRTLQERWAERRPQTVLARNAADFDFFQQATGADPLPGVEGPVAGFFGAIAEWFDRALMASVAKARPEVTFVLVGGVHRISVDELEALPNVRLEGFQPYEKMPRYLRRFDACLLPFVVSPVTHGVDPVKLYEYLSQGKPVVSTRFREIIPYGELLYLARDAEDFRRQLDRALGDDPPTARARRIRFAQENTWTERLDRLEEAIRDARSKPTMGMPHVSNAP